MTVLTENAMTLLCKRYFLKDPILAPGGTHKLCDKCKQSHETVDSFFDRMSLGNSSYRSMISNLVFLPNSPTLFNMGTGQGTLSACFKFDVKDSMLGPGSIMDVAVKAAAVQKFGGGVGYYLGGLRPYGAPIRSTHGRACGPVAVLKFYHAVAEMITQAGKRDGAQMGIMDCDHKDIREFIHCKDIDPQGLSTFNISVSCTDSFMSEVVNNPSSPQAKLFQEMAESAWKTGDPGCYFVDVAERENPTPWLGRLTGTNPCGEVPLLDNEPCNLGSIDLSSFVADIKGTTFDYEGLKDVVHTATHYLDDVLDKNTFPMPEIDKIAKTTRKLGLGVMGWADTLALMGIPYDTQEAVDMGSEIMKTINDEAFETSKKLTKSKGPNPAYYDHDPKTALVMSRNATRTCIAPTGSISIIAGCSSGIEPHYRLKWVRKLGDGTLLDEKVPVLDRLHNFVPKTADEVPWQWHVKHQAAFQKHTDLAVSKTINMPESATMEDVRQAYIMMWQTGCKGGTIYRNKSRSVQVLTDTKPETEKHSHPPTLVPFHKPLPVDVKSIRHKFRVGDAGGFVHAGMYEDESLAEVFLTMVPGGSTLDGMADALAITTSLALQHGVPLETLVHHLENRRFEPAGLTNDPKIPTATSIVGYVFRWLKMRFGPNVDSKQVNNGHTGMQCPECGAPAISQEACLVCSAGCGWTKC